MVQDLVDAFSDDRDPKIRHGRPDRKRMQWKNPAVSFG